jgi:hypothetical protein
MIGRSFEVYLRLRALPHLTFESLAITLYLRRQLLSMTYCSFPQPTVATLPRVLLVPITIITNYNLPATYCSYSY